MKILFMISENVFMNWQTFHRRRGWRNQQDNTTWHHRTIDTHKERRCPGKSFLLAFRYYL